MKPNRVGNSGWWEEERMQPLAGVVGKGRYLNPPPMRMIPPLRGALHPRVYIAVGPWRSQRWSAKPTQFTFLLQPEEGRIKYIPALAHVIQWASLFSQWGLQLSIIWFVYLPKFFFLPPSLVRWGSSLSSLTLKLPPHSPSLSAYTFFQDFMLITGLWCPQFSSRRIQSLSFLLLDQCLPGLS